MSILQRLFGGSKAVSMEELRVALKEVEKDRRKNRLEIRRHERKRRKILDKLKKARTEGNGLEVDYLWDEFKEQRRSATELRREGRVYNIEGVALKRYLRALERLERRQDREGATKLIERVSRSGLVERLTLDREAEVLYLEEMNNILEEFDGLEEAEKEDPEKALFLAEIDTIQKAESEGNDEDAASRQEELLERFGEEPETELP